MTRSIDALHEHVNKSSDSHPPQHHSGGNLSVPTSVTPREGCCCRVSGTRRRSAMTRPAQQRQRVTREKVSVRGPLLSTGNGSPGRQRTGRTTTAACLPHRRHRQPPSPPPPVSVTVTVTTAVTSLKDMSGGCQSRTVSCADINSTIRQS